MVQLSFMVVEQVSLDDYHVSYDKLACDLMPGDYFRLGENCSLWFVESVMGERQVITAVCGREVFEFSNAPNAASLYFPLLEVWSKDG